MNSSSKISGYVQQGDGPYVANAGVGLTAAQGTPISTTNQAWGSSGLNNSRPIGNAGHKVDADGPLTASTGDQAVAPLDERP